MHRRKYLAMLSASVGGLVLAGCSSDSNDGGDGSDDGGTDNSDRSTDSGDDEENSESDSGSGGDENDGNDGNGNTDVTNSPEATIREYINAFCNKNVSKVNELHSKYGIEGTVAESGLPDADCSISNLQEQGFPGDSEKFLQNEDITELKYYTFTLTADGDTEETSIALALQNGEWKVLDVG